jgi:hypothetical protein
MVGQNGGSVQSAVVIVLLPVKALGEEIELGKGHLGALHGQLAWLVGGLAADRQGLFDAREQGAARAAELLRGRAQRRGDRQCFSKRFESSFHKVRNDKEQGDERWKTYW